MAMKPNQQRTVVGVFTNRESAQKAVRELKTAGFTESEIGLVSAGGDQDNLGVSGASDDDSYAAEGAATGVATGAGVGALWGLGILAGALPAIGPAIAGGTLAALLSSAAAGAATAGLAGALLGVGMSKEEAEYYEGELNAGRTIVTVRAGSRISDAAEVLQRFGGYDISTRGAVAATSATNSSPSNRVTSAADVCATADQVGSGTIQAREEQLRVERYPVEAGEVSVRKEVHTEHKTVEVPVMREEVVISRHAPQSGDVSTGQIQPGEEIRIPVRAEQVHVEKEVVATEEVTVGKRQVADTRQVAADLRKEEIKIETQGDVKARGDQNRGRK